MHFPGQRADSLPGPAASLATQHPTSCRQQMAPLHTCKPSFAATGHASLQQRSSHSLVFDLVLDRSFLANCLPMGNGSTSASPRQHELVLHLHETRTCTRQLP